MTNKHCDACGDPVFRQNGQEFCPTCGQAADDDVAARTAQAEAAAEQDAESEGTGRPQQPQTDSVRADQPAQHTGQQRSGGAGGEQIDQRVESSVDQHVEPSVDQRPKTQGGQPAETPSGQPAATPGGDLAGAQSALAETITRLAQQAAGESDPRQAKERLAAAREAAEALDALRR